jgi:uncharacterized protein (TIGR03083 family)
LEEAMSDEQEQLGRSWGLTASDAFHASAAYFRSLPNDAWSGPTGCADWSERTLAGHIVGEAVWFPNMVKSITAGERPHPASLYEEMKTWPAERQSARLDDAADELRATLGASIPRYAYHQVDLGWMKVPLWQATYIILMESVYHDWDTRAGREPGSTIPTPWAVELAKGIDFSAPLIAHRGAVAGAPGRYMLQVGDGTGPITVVAAGGELTVEKGAQGTSDVTLYLTADQCVRLVAGRFKLADPVDRGEVGFEGDRALIEGLNRIFGGIANG